MKTYGSNKLEGRGVYVLSKITKQGFGISLHVYGDSEAEAEESGMER